MIGRIVVILIAMLLQFATTACSSQRQSTHTVCPEASMTLSSDSHGSHSPTVDLAGDIDNAAAIVCHSGYEAFAAQSQTQARANGWQWLRAIRCEAKCLIAGISALHAVKCAVHSTTFGIDTQSTGYVFAIRHIII